ncbi:MAG: hypothetical protein HC812_00400 [Leptolyngbya sp. RL_3_1]|nr:hypothetical protein [Leptolyngbya sp. RL_3_1]
MPAPDLCILADRINPDNSDPEDHATNRFVGYQFIGCSIRNFYGLITAAEKMGRIKTSSCTVCLHPQILTAISAKALEERAANNFHNQSGLISGAPPLN